MKRKKALFVGLAIGLLALGGWKAFSHFRGNLPATQVETQRWICPMRCLNRVYAKAGECDVCHMKLKEHYESGPPPLPASAGLRLWPLLGGKTAVYYRPFTVRRLGVEKYLRAAGTVEGRTMQLKLSAGQRRGLRKGGSAMVMPPQGYARPVQAEIKVLSPSGKVTLKLSRPLTDSAWGLAEIRVAFEPELAVPLAALMEDGPQAIVFVMHGDSFEPRTVTVTTRGESYAGVQGLKEGDVVAGSGLFWLNAEWRMEHP